MQSVQLYIGDTRIDLFEDETITLNQSIQNVRDISKVFTDFSQTFTVPASRNNNKIFKHYYNYNIDNGFDARKKASAKIELNSKKFRDGKIRLDGVNLKHGSPNSYRITFFGNTVSLKDLLAEDNLASLDWLNKLSLDYDSSTVLQAFNGGVRTTIEDVEYEVVAPFITHTRRPIYDSRISEAQAGTMNLFPYNNVLQGLPYTELKYGIPIKAIVKAIEESGYGIKFSSHFFNEENLAFSNLYMWLHRKKGGAFEGNEVTNQITSFPTNLSELIGVACYPDRLLVFNSSQGVSYTLRVESNTTDPYTVIIKRDGQVFNSATASGGLILEMSGVLTNSSTGYSVFIQTQSAITELDAEWQITSIQYPENYTYVAQTESIGLTNSFRITEQIPEMKIIDFLTGLFKLFNLTAYEEDGVIQVKTLDEFYSSTTDVDASTTEISADSTQITADIASTTNELREITNYIDLEAHTVDSVLPFQEITFEYEGLGTKLAENHNQTFNQGWGTGDYDGGDRYDSAGSVYKVTAPFEHMKYERLLDYDDTTSTTVQVGWFVDDNDSSYYGKPLLFYPVVINSITSEDPVTNIRFLTDDSYSDTTTYIIPSNTLTVDSAESKDSIHYNVELNEYTYSGDFTDTLFEKYYKTYITDIFNAKLRLSKYKAYFDVRFLLDYKLSDTVQILDRVYRINSITTNLQTGESDLELLNIASASAAIIVEGCTADITSITADTEDVRADVACEEPIPLPTTTTTTTEPTTTTTSTTTTSTTTTTLPNNNVFVVERQSDSFVTYAQLVQGYNVNDVVTISNDGSNCYDIISLDYVVDPSIFPVITGSCGTTTTTTSTTTTTTEPTTTTTTEGTTTTTTEGTTTTTETPCIQRIAYSPIPTQSIEVGSNIIINLNNYFTQLDGQPLYYLANDISEYVESVSIAGSQLTINANSSNLCGTDSTGVIVEVGDGIEGNCEYGAFISVEVFGCTTTTLPTTTTTSTSTTTEPTTTTTEPTTTTTSTSTTTSTTEPTTTVPTTSTTSTSSTSTTTSDYN